MDILTAWLTAAKPTVEVINPCKAHRIMSKSCRILPRIKACLHFDFLHRITQFGHIQYRIESKLSQAHIFRDGGFSIFNVHLGEPVLDCSNLALLQLLQKPSHHVWRKDDSNINSEFVPDILLKNPAFNKPLGITYANTTTQHTSSIELNIPDSHHPEWDFTSPHKYQQLWAYRLLPCV